MLGIHKKCYYVATKPHSTLRELEQEYKLLVNLAANRSLTSQERLVKIRKQLSDLRKQIKLASSIQLYNRRVSTMTIQQFKKFVFTPIYVAMTAIGETEEIVVTDDLVYAQHSDYYRLVSLEELNATAGTDEDFQGKLFTLEGLCQYDNYKKEYKLLVDSEHFYKQYDEAYINHLHSSNNTSVEKLTTWLRDIHLYNDASDWQVRYIKKYVDTDQKASEFFERFANVYNYNCASLGRCIIDLIDKYKQVAV